MAAHDNQQVVERSGERVEESYMAQVWQFRINGRVHSVRRYLWLVRPEVSD